MDKASIRIVVLLISVIVMGIPGLLCQAVENQESIFSNDTLLEYEDAYEQYKVQVLSEEYNSDGVFEGIYVARNGWFLLVFAEGSKHHINVYNQSCQLNSHFVIEESGKLLAMIDELDNNVVLFPVRDHVIIEINNTGEYVSAWSIEDDIFSDLIDKLSPYRAFEFSVADNTYSFQGQKLLSRNHQVFCVTDGYGQTVFSYRPGMNKADKLFLLNGIILLIILLVIFRFGLHKKRV